MIGIDGGAGTGVGHGSSGVTGEGGTAKCKDNVADGGGLISIMGGRSYEGSGSGIRA